jgi:hypothetical protein
MRHLLLGGVAIAALVAAGLSAAAQTSTTDRTSGAQTGATATGQAGTSSGASSRSGATTPSDTSAQTGTSTSKSKHSAKAKRTKGEQAMAQHRGGRSPEDTMAEELNRQELQKLQQSAGQLPSSGTSTQGPTQTPAPGTTTPKQ